MDNSVTSKKRIDWIDVAKGIAIMLTIIGHTVPFNSLPRNIIYSFHMPLFFVLSGYTINISNLNGKSIIDSTKKDFVRLITPVFITLFLDSVLSVIMLKSSVFSAFFYNIYKLVWGNCDNYGPEEGAIYSIEFIGLFALWFFIALFIGKLCYRIFCMYIKEYRMIILLFMSFLAMCVGKVIWLPYCIDLIPIVMVFLQFGNILKEKIDMKSEKWKACGVIAFFVWIYFVVEKDVYAELAARIYKGSILGILVAFLGCVCMIQVAQGMENLKLSNPLIFLGQNSLVLVCINCLDKFFTRYWNIVIFPAESGKAVLNIVITCIMRLGFDIILLIVWVYLIKAVKSLIKNRK